MPISGTGAMTGKGHFDHPAQNSREDFIRLTTEIKDLREECEMKTTELTNLHMQLKDKLEALSLMGKEIFEEPPGDKSENRSPLQIII